MRRVSDGAGASVRPYRCGVVIAGQTKRRNRKPPITAYVFVFARRLEIRTKEVSNAISARTRVNVDASSAAIPSLEPSNRDITLELRWEQIWKYDAGIYERGHYIVLVSYTSLTNNGSRATYVVSMIHYGINDALTDSHQIICVRRCVCIVIQSLRMIRISLSESSILEQTARFDRAPHPCGDSTQYPRFEESKSPG